MSLLLDILALGCLAFGLLFLTGAVVGVLRFHDPLQRMHASTKAGTLGAMFTVLGSILALRDPTALFIGVATLVFLVLTVPVAGHILGRAIYMSGAHFEGENLRDALAGHLERQPHSHADDEDEDEEEEDPPGRRR